MNYYYKYKTPQEFDDITLISDGKYLTGLIFDNSEIDNSPLAIFDQTCKWLDIYFSGKQPEFTIDLKLSSRSFFRTEVWDMLKNIDYGKTVTYGDMAKVIAMRRAVKKMSAQAVGNAVGANPICIIVPCHRVIGVNGNLTGYGGGLKNKIALLKLEGNDISNYHLPKERKNGNRL